MKCDLHIHTIHSGMCTVPVLKRICRESYNDPREVYSVLKRKGMDLVTLTDHDSIGGLKDFIVMRQRIDALDLGDDEYAFAELRRGSAHCLDIGAALDK